MTFKRFVGLAMIACLLLLSAIIVAETVCLGELPENPKSISAWANNAVTKRLSAFDSLKSLAPNLLLKAGAKEQDGIFISNNYLLENIAAPDDAVLEANLLGIENFVDNSSTPISFALIPTACAIKQQELPAGASLFNQKQLISDCYSRLAGRAGSVDAYSSLFASKEQYTYCRTETALTGLGGYYVYTALAARMGFSPRDLNQFEVENLPQSYYGELYSRCAYKDISPDLITVYRFSRFSRQYRLNITQNGEQKSYYTLFPTHLAELGQPRQVLLGGLGERTDISVVSPYEETLLILGDETVSSFLPFLVVHYGDITVLDISKCSDDMLKNIDSDSYDQILFCYSVDNFIHDDVCSRASLLGVDAV
ncbi:MAG: hypothetical protein J6C75_06905 [Oscillospiraceae bacterium]|nr:hypothetical protein [Oscillospiraceae bacterium]